MKLLLRGAIPAVAALCLLLPAAAEAQIGGSVGAGVTVPSGDFGDRLENGFTVRGQLGVSLLVASVHGQVGWTRFPSKDLVNLELEDLDIFHYGVGARVGMGLFWVGLNGAYFSGFDDDDDDGAGIFPEVGVGLGSLEAVADYRVDGDARWLSIRAAVKF